MNFQFSEFKSENQEGVKDFQINNSIIIPDACCNNSFWCWFKFKTSANLTFSFPRLRFRRTYMEIMVARYWSKKTLWQKITSIQFRGIKLLQWWTFENEHQPRLNQLNDYLLSSYSSVSLIWSLKNLVFETLRYDCWILKTNLVSFGLGS